MNASKKIALALTIAALFASCATKPSPPAPEPTPPAPTAPEQPAEQPSPPAASAFDQAAMDALEAEVLALKKKAFDLGLAELLRDDYKTADASYLAGRKAYEAKDETGTREAFTTARGLFTDLLDRGLKQLISSEKSKIEEYRAAAVREAADRKAADRFTAGDAASSEAQALEAAGSAEEALAAYRRARSLFELSQKRAKAGALRAAIEARGYAAWDSGNFRIAENRYAEEENLFGANGGKAAAEIASGIDALDESILRYNLVIEKGREGSAAASMKKTGDAKTRAEGIKANVAVKAEFDAALAVYKEAQAALEAKNYELAVDKFTAAEGLFERAYATAADKRRQAEEAMRAAETASDESKRKAEEAEPLVGAEPTQP